MAKKQRVPNKTLIEKGRRALVESIKQRREFQNRELRDRAKRLVTSEFNHRPLLNAMPVKAGLDPVEFDRERQRDWELLVKDVARQQKEVIGILKRKRMRQREAFRTVMKHRKRFEYKKGNPHTSICLWRASQRPNVLVNEVPFSDGSFRFIPIDAFRNVGNNIVRFNAEVLGVAPGQSPGIGQFSHFAPTIEDLDLVTEHRFETTAPHAGRLSVTATYAPLGSVALRAPGALIAPGSAWTDLQGYIRVIITAARGGSFELPFGETKTIVNQNDASVEAGFNANNKVVVVDSDHGLSYQLAQNNLVQVDAGDQITVISGYDLRIGAALRGDATATFSPAPLGLNVPLVLVTIAG
jgi:hypothetical protein